MCGNNGKSNTASILEYQTMILLGFLKIRALGLKKKYRYLIEFASPEQPGYHGNVRMGAVCERMPNISGAGCGLGSPAQLSKRHKRHPCMPNKTVRLLQFSYQLFLTI